MPLLLLALIAVVVGVGGIVYALKTGHAGLTEKIVIAILILGGVYFSVLFAVSITSREKALEQHQVKKFCGFYLDCHLGVSVENVNLTKTLGNPPEQQRAEGVYYVITVKVSSDAKGATLDFVNPQATVVDDQGRKYSRSLDGERALEKAQGKAIPFGQAVGPQGDSYTKELVFDLPENVHNPSLIVTDGLWIERLLELFLIGDEDSLFHKKTKLRLEPHSGAGGGRNYAHEGAGL